MPKYIVTVSYTGRFQKEIHVYAKDEAEAEEKACDIVAGWTNIEDTEAIDCEEAS